MLRSTTLLVLLAVLCPSGALAQRWEVELLRVAIDHDHPRTTSGRGEQIPPGLGLAARHLWDRGFFVGLDGSRGSERRWGAICGGFIIDPETQCIGETVRYSGGLVALTGGWLGSAAIGSRWTVGASVRTGLGAVWVRESGEDTGRGHSESPLAYLLGGALEGSYVLPGEHMALTASVGADRLRPFGRDRCEDCRQIVRDPLPGWSVGLGVRWRRR